MVRRSILARLVTVMLLWQMAPGVSELVENVLHLSREGHLAHARHDAKHQPRDREHDCSGPYHFCACHCSRVFTMTRREPILASPRRVTTLRAAAAGRPLVGYSAAVFRPPIA